MDNVTPHATPSFDAQLTAALMIQSNALISIKTVTKMCSLSRQEIDRRIYNGTFPKPEKLSSESKSIRKAFYLQDIHTWIADPQGYNQDENTDKHTLN